jgi:hypothetical protein
MIWSYTGWPVVKHGEEVGELGIAESGRVVQVWGSGLWIWGRILLYVFLVIDNRCRPFFGNRQGNDLRERTFEEATVAEN